MMLFGKKCTYKQDLERVQSQANINFLNHNLLDMRREFNRLGLSINEANNLLSAIKQAEKCMIEANIKAHSFNLEGVRVTLENDLLKLILPQNGNIPL